MPKILTVIIGFILFLFSSQTTVGAYFYSLKDFYDWGPWYYRGQGRVLAEATQAAGATPSAQASPSANIAVEEQSATSAAAQADVKDVTGLLPDSPFYFLKPFSENVGLTFTFDPKAKEDRRLQLSEERLGETKALLTLKKYNLASKNFSRYKNVMALLSKNLQILKDKNLSLEDLAKKSELNGARHSLVLEKLSLLVPEDMKDDVDDAIDASKKGMDVSADVLGRDPVPPDLKQRLESLKAMGIIPAGEVAAVFSLKSREEVRKELNRLAQQDYLPESDTKQLDEAQYGYFPADFLRVFEVRKLYEFKKLEELKPDTETQKKIAEFASTYKPGEPIPSDIKRWWVPLQRYQELQATMRPDLVVNSLMPKGAEEYKRFENIFERFKPSEDQLKSVEKWVQDNPGKVPPPELQRIASLAVNLGAPFGSTIEWKPPEQIRAMVHATRGFPGIYVPPAGFTETGGPAYAGTSQTTQSGGPGTDADFRGVPPAFPRFPGYRIPSTLYGFRHSDPTNIPGSPAPYCLKTETKAKHSFTGEIKIFPDSCIPMGWYAYYGPEKPGDKPVFNPPPFMGGQPQPGLPYTEGSPPPGGFPNQPGTPNTGGYSYCPLPNSSGELKDGRCRIINCFVGWTNNDGRDDNGCETSASGGNTSNNTTSGSGTSTTIDTTTGGTATSCYLQNASSYRDAAGICRISICYTGWSNSDGHDGNGCEKASGTSTGTVTTSCSIPNGNGTQGSDGICRISSCQTGWYNNDGLDSNGCESNTSGGGGTTTPCSLANATSNRDSQGICRITSCNTGWTNNDAVDSNGCETSSSSSSTTSPTPTPLPSCSLPNTSSYRDANGTCRVQTCYSGWQNIDNQDANGCETSSSTQNTACSLPNASAYRDSTGLCRIQTCNSGWYNNNGNESDGCEYQQGSGGNTGGTSCPLPHGMGQMVGGICQVYQCETYWYNKNGVHSDGCESPTP